MCYSAHRLKQNGTAIKCGPVPRHVRKIVCINKQEMDSEKKCRHLRHFYSCCGQGLYYAGRALQPCELPIRVPAVLAYG